MSMDWDEIVDQMLDETASHPRCHPMEVRRRPAHGVELVTGRSVKLGAYSQITFRSQLPPAWRSSPLRRRRSPPPMPRSA